MRPGDKQTIGENTMFRRIVCVVMMLVIFAAGTVLTGCGDDIKTDRKTEIEKMPIGEPQPVID